MSSSAAIYPEVTLPIDRSDGGLQMEAIEARALGGFLHNEYSSANPFPHIVVDNFLPEELIRDVLENFPLEEVSEERTFEMGYAGQHKRQILPDACNAFNREFFRFLNSRPVLQYLEGLTGIDGLLPDPYYVGGGFHETSRGGLLGVHADFRINDQLHVQRRINLLIYLNPIWNDDWKGQLELWSKDMKECVTRISPILNRCVVFSTDADTWHGHPDELLTPHDVKRRSIAMYYYTASKNIYKEIPNLSTMYRARDVDSGEIRSVVRGLRSDELMKDWLPPIVSRYWFRVRDAIRRKINR
jgi:Rps23 Pro-64 3,4-dihydroxylase Tpa1-like proline 4-hydroxylase